MSEIRVRIPQVQNARVALAKQRINACVKNINT